MRLALLLLASPLIVGALPRERAAPSATPSPLARLVRFEDSVRNESAETLHDVRCSLLLPETSRGQRLRWLRLSGHDWTLARDADGQWHASAAVPRLAPGEAVTFGWLAAVELDARRLPRAPVRLADAARRAALADDPILGLDDPAIRAAADRVRGAVPGDDAEALAVAALGHVRERVRYELDGGWRPAPEVLAAGAGSCSETTFLYVALCRRLGIPARWVGGTLQRSGTPGRAVDATFHRQAEVWLPGRGWVRVETTPGPGDVEPPRALRDSTVPLLVLARGSGGEGAAGLYYHARNEWSVPAGSRARPRVAKRAFWVTDTHRIAGDADPLATLAEGQRPSFARCEVLLADAEGFGPAVASGTIGAPDPRARRRRALPEEALPWLFASGHPGALRLAARVANRDAALVPGVWAAGRDACGSDLHAAFAPVLGRGGAAFEAWWARHAPAVAPERPGRLTLVTPGR